MLAHLFLPRLQADLASDLFRGKQQQKQCKRKAKYICEIKLMEM